MGLKACYRVVFNVERLYLIRGFAETRSSSARRELVVAGRRVMKM
jgi:hypothetical protein